MGTVKMAVYRMKAFKALQRAIANGDQRKLSRALANYQEWNTADVVGTSPAAKKAVEAFIASMK